jgi:hypothetical protein
MRARVVPHVGSAVEGESLSFVLAAATATYTTEGRQWGARLVFGDEPDQAE